MLSGCQDLGQECSESGEVYLCQWLVREDLYLDYVIHCSSSPSLEDVWVDWKQVILLESCS